MKKIALLAAISTIGVFVISGAYSLQTKSDSNPANANAEQQIQALEDESLHAALVGDTDYLEKYLADDYVQIGNGGVESGKEKQMELRKTGGIKYEVLKLKRRKIRIYGNTAVVNMESDADYTYTGKHIEGLFRATRVWVKKDGAWKIEAFQTVKVTSGN